MKGERLSEQRTEVTRAERGREAERETGSRVIVAMNEETERAPDAKAEVKYWSREYNDTERQFAKYNKEMPADKAGREDYRTTLAKYEEDIAYNWERLQSTSNQALSERLISSVYELADTQGLGAVEPHETVEAATGIFYKERMEALSQAVASAQMPEITGGGE